MKVDAEYRAYALTITRVQRKAIARLGLADELLCNMVGIGKPTMDQPVAYGIVQTAGEYRRGEPICKLTKHGDMLREAF